MTEEEFLQSLDAKLDYAATAMKTRQDSRDAALEAFREFKDLLRRRLAEVRTT